MSSVIIPHKETIVVKKLNDVYMTISCSQHIEKEISDYFTYYEENYKFDPRYKKGYWDGKLKLFDKRGNKLFIGLLPSVVTFANQFNYDLSIDQKLNNFTKIELEKVYEFMDEKIQPYIKDKYGTLVSPYDYQYNALHKAIEHKRCLLKCPTGSGKSLIAYSIIRFLQQRKNCKKILLIVPTTSLVEQMYSDFVQYSTENGWDVEKNCHRIHQMYDKHSDKQVFISTWQSIFEMPKDYFKQFNGVVVDECHGAPADSIQGIMKKLEDCPYRIGMTGTLRDTKTSLLVLQGLFGKIFTMETTRNLIDRGILSDIEINMLELSYDKSECKTVSTMKYKDELDYICQHTKRNLFIKNLALNLKGNTLVLFQYVENHGELLRNLIETDASATRKVFFVYGGTPTTQREEIRHIVENETDAIIIASYGTFSTGTNIRNIINIIYASPSKSKIRILQSIGRGLRLALNKTGMILFDIVDDFEYDGRNNYVLEHSLVRLKYYEDEQFGFKIHPIKL